MSNGLDRELEILNRQYEAGEISLQEYNEAVRDLEREDRAEAHEAAERAYRETLENF